MMGKESEALKKKYKEPLYDRYPYLPTVISMVALLLSLFVILIKVCR